MSGSALASGSAAAAPAPPLIVDRLWALEEESNAIWGRPPPGERAASAGKWTPYLHAAQRHAPAALCLSGGGIRSAAFALGVMQGLARLGLLTRFHYLSTVSGGGYAGGWLTRWIVEEEKRLRQAAEQAGMEAGLTAEEARAAASEARAARARRREAAASVEAQLANPEPPRSPPPPGQSGREAPPLRELRRWTNFLTPQTGFASTDTMAGLALWLRNLLLTWLILMPAFMALAMLPEVAQAGALVLASLPFPAWAATAPLGLLLAVAVWRSCAELPSYAHPATGPSPPEAEPEKVVRRLRHWIVWLSWLWAFLLPLALAKPLLAEGPGHAATIGAATSLAACLVGYVFAAWRTQGHRRHFVANLGWWGLACAGSAGLLWLGLFLAHRLLHDWGGLASWPLRLALAVSLLPLCVLGAQMVLTVLYAGLRNTEASPAHEAPQGAPLLRRLGAGWRRSWEGWLHRSLRETPASLQPDLDREWMARLSALKLPAPLAWAALGLVCLVLPALLGSSALTGPALAEWWKQATAVVGAVSGAVAWLLGGSGATGGAKPLAGGGRWRVPLDWLAVAASYVFLAALLFGLSRAGVALARWLSGAEPGFSLPQGLAVLAGAALLSVLAARKFRVNRFSMHATYRNRLVRAFLGSARATGSGMASRNAEPFTAFDGADNLPMHSLWPAPPPAGETEEEQKPLPLFPVINLALNVTGAEEIAWQERKALSFSVTPLRCGWSNPLEATARHFGSGAGYYADSARYAGQEGDASWIADQSRPGITLGTAMTLSGAALSPNMGYHSSPATALVLTLFNARLGAWLPNPAPLTPGGRLRTPSEAQEAERLRRSSPRFALGPLFDELRGSSKTTSPYVYLSDGGHFDNLGLYEMVRRRCRFVVVSDASADAGCGFGDLGMAVRKIFIDQGVRIEFPSLPMLPRAQALAGDPRGFVLGEIHYPDMPGRKDHTPDGWLLYIKPQWRKDLPADIRAYADANALFPHESTGDQWFAESQFEAYRRLGEITARAAMADRLTLPNNQSISLADLFR